MWEIDPFVDFDKRVRNMHRLFHDFNHPLVNMDLAPRLAVGELKVVNDKIIAELELPGVDKKDIELNVTQTDIEVKAAKTVEQHLEDRKKGFEQRSMNTVQFYRKVPLPADVIVEKAVAEFKNGLLKVELPLAKPIGQKAQRLQIK
ncbi:Hsp20/alpha crystallin family protein [Candidatus Woesearchaeota archaeon]|nr:Hsp20/alpha crystallin family protein [Candidatus Woesearchaeota archaeon]